MAEEALLGFLSGMMKKKEEFYKEKFKEELKRKADLNALFEEIKLKNQLETEREAAKPKKSANWINTITKEVIQLPEDATQEQKDAVKAKGFVPESVYPQVKPEAPKKEKIPFETLPKEIKTIVPYWDSLDQDLQDVLIQSYTEESLKQQKLVRPTGTVPEPKSLLETIRQATTGKPQQAGALPSLKDIKIPSKILDYIHSQ